MNYRLKKQLYPSLSSCCSEFPGVNYRSMNEVLLTYHSSIGDNPMKSLYLKFFLHLADLTAGQCILSSEIVYCLFLLGFTLL